MEIHQRQEPGVVCDLPSFDYHAKQTSCIPAFLSPPTLEAANGKRGRS